MAHLQRHGQQKTASKAVFRNRAATRCATPGMDGRGKRIRTSGPCVPNAVLYQAELFPDTGFLTVNNLSRLQRRAILATALEKGKGAKRKSLRRPVGLRSARIRARRRARHFHR